MARMKLVGSAKCFWKTVMRDVELRRRAPVLSWVDMRGILRNKYVPPYYMSDLLSQFQNLRQNTSTVHEYISTSEELLLRCQVDEEQPVLVTTFVNGLRADIRREVQVHNLFDLDSAYQKALDYEKYLRYVPRRFSPNMDTSPNRHATLPQTNPTSTIQPPSGSPTIFPNVAKYTLLQHLAPALFPHKTSVTIAVVKGT